MCYAHDMLVYSNMAYLAPPMVMLTVRWKTKTRLRPWDALFIVGCCMLCVASSFYHSCDTASGFVTCDVYCIASFHILQGADSIAAVTVVHLALLLSWEPTHVVAKTYTLFITFLLPFLVLYSDGSWPLYTLVDTMAVADIGMRVAFHSPGSVDTDEQEMPFASSCTRRVSHWIQVTFSLSGWKAWAIYVPFMVAAGVCAISLFAVVNGPDYWWAHGTWHLGTASALSLSPFVWHSPNKYTPLDTQEGVLELGNRSAVTPSRRHFKCGIFFCVNLVSFFFITASQRTFRQHQSVYLFPSVYVDEQQQFDLK